MNKLMLNLYIIGITITLLLLHLSPSLMAQAVSGTLLGTLTDTTGAAVTNAGITVLEASTGGAHRTTTNDSGNYTLPNLPPGVYSVTGEAPGFKKVTQPGINLESNSSTRIDLVLTPGSVSETVMVTTAKPFLQTDRADISTKLESKDVLDMPLGTNRNFQSLLNLVPGTSPAVFQHSQFFNAASTLQTEVNGLPREGNLYQIEGIDDDERTGLLQIIIPPAEAIASVDISTNNFEAELGRATGAVTNVTLKSGTNSIHGSAFEFIQNSAVNARSYFGGPLGHLSYNYFGGSIGGPIRKNKIFYFGDYLHTTDHEAISNTLTVPDARYFTANATGYVDLSGAKVGASGQIYDPATGDGTAAHPRSPFVNNQIPFQRINPVSLAILRGVNAAAAQYGLLNSTKPLSNPSNNYTSNLPFQKTTDSVDTKMDFSINENNHLSARYSFQRVVTFQQAAFGAFFGGPAGGGFEGTGDQKAYSTGVNYDHVFSSKLLTEIRFGVAHLRNNAQPNDYGSEDATSLGVPGVNLAGQPLTTGQAAITLGNFSGPLIGYSPSVPWIRGEANIDFVNNWTRIIGNHTLKAGIDIRRVRDDLLQDATFSPRGAFTFSEPQTSQVGAATNIANDIASFLLDQPSQVGRDLNTFFPCYRQWWLFAFVSDKFQATSKLTIDAGVRWEFYPPATPRQAGGFSNYDPATNSLVLAGIAGNPSNLGMATRYRYFAPRTGLSYRVSNDTVVRGGFGVSYTPYPYNIYAYNYPIRANNSYQPAGSSPFTPAVLADNSTVATFQNGFPAPVPVAIPANGIISASTPQLVNQVYYYIPLNYKNPYSLSWNVAIQQALRGNLSLQVAYVANHGVNIDGYQNINLPSTYGGGNASLPENIAFGRTAATFQYFRGFSSNYQSLQVSLNKRLSSGLSFTSAFTWGKALNYITGDEAGLLFYINQRRNYAPADFDRKVNFEESFTYELPVGRGHRMMGGGVGAAVLGGWKISGIVSVVSGLPFTVSANGSSLNTPGTTQTAVLTGRFNSLHGVGSNTHWFDPSVFSQPSGCTALPCTSPGLGNTGRNQFRGPGYLQDNLSLFKKFALVDELALETRLDAFQLSNTPQFANPNSSNIAASNFGQVTSTLGSGQGSVNGVGGGRTLQASIKFTF